LPEPTTTASIAAAIVTGLSGFTLAMLGVDYYSLLWALVGAFLALFQGAPMGRVRAMLFMVLSTLIGAALGTGGIDAFGSDSTKLLIVFSLVSGYGAQLLMSTLLGASVKRIDKLGGD